MSLPLRLTLGAGLTDGKVMKVLSLIAIGYDER